MNNYLSPSFLLIPVFSMVTILSSCSTHSESAEVVTTISLDQAAETYVKLGLELGEYDADYVDAYLGSVEWEQNAKEHLRSKQQLAKDIAELLKMLKKQSFSDREASLRHKALLLNIRAMDIRIRMVNGEKFTFAEEALWIYDTKLPDYSFKEFDDALAEIEKLIPGEGDLAERVDAFRKSFIIPDKKVNMVVDLAIEECRKRSARYISLPKNERFTLEYVTDKSWSGYNWYQGDNNSLMQINQDFPMKIDRAIGLGCHEGYPGHHVWNVLVENQLLKQKGWIEFSLFPLFSPYALIAEGSANYGVDLAFPDDEKIEYERDVLFPIAGLAPEKAKTLDQLNKLTVKLSHALTATAQLYLNEEITRQQAIEQRRKYSLSSKARAEQSVKFIEQYRAYVLNYNLGKSIVSDYIKAQGDTPEARWKAFEKMLTELSTASDMAAYIASM